MDVLWMVNTNTFLLVILVIMISYLTMQVNAVIRFFEKRIAKLQTTQKAV